MARSIAEATPNATMYGRKISKTKQRLPKSNNCVTRNDEQRAITDKDSGAGDTLPSEFTVHCPPPLFPGRTQRRLFEGKTQFLVNYFLANVGQSLTLHTMALVIIKHEVLLFGEVVKIIFSAYMISKQSGGTERKKSVKAHIIHLLKTAKKMVRQGLRFLLYSVHIKLTLP